MGKVGGDVEGAIEGPSARTLLKARYSLRYCLIIVFYFYVLQIAVTISQEMSTL